MLNHGLGLFITSDALDLSRANTTDHVTDSLGDGSLKHLIQLTHVHAQVVDVVTVLVNVEHDRYVNLRVHKDRMNHT